MDGATPQQEAQSTKKKHIVPEGEISGLIPTVLIGRDTLLRDNPICYPVQNLRRGCGDPGSRRVRSIASTGVCGEGTQENLRRAARPPNNGRVPKTPH